MATKIMILNGPKLEFPRHSRAPHLCPTTLKEIEASCQALADDLRRSISFHQPNLEANSST